MRDTRWLETWGHALGRRNLTFDGFRGDADSADVIGARIVSSRFGGQDGPIGFTGTPSAALTSYSLTPSNTTVVEGNTSITFTITRSGNISSSATGYASTLFDSTALSGVRRGPVNDPIADGIGEAAAINIARLNAARSGAGAPGPALGPAIVDTIVAATEHLATRAAIAVSPTADATAPSSDLVDAMNYLMGDFLGLDRGSKLIEVEATRSTNSEGHITIELKYKLGAWPQELLDQLPSSILSIDIDTRKLAGNHDYTIEIQDKIQSQLDKFIAGYVDKAVSNIGGIEHGVAVAASTALKNLLGSEITKHLANEFADSLLDFELPDRADIVRILGDGFDKIRDDYVGKFVPEIAKTYAKFGLTEILTTIGSGLDPKWATALSDVGHGVLDQVISNLVDNYFGAAPVSAFNGVVFADVFGRATANLLIDFKALDKQIVDDILGIDGKGVIDQWLTEFLNDKINDFVTDQFSHTFKFLAGDIEAPNLDELFRQFSGQFSIEQIRGLLGDFFINYAGQQLAQLFVNIDSLPEALVSQLGSVIGSGVLGEAIGSITMGALGDLFGIATWGAIGTSIFNGLGAILGAGVGAVAGSVVFELLDDLFDGAISGFFEDILEWIRNDSPQAFYGTHYDVTLNEYIHLPTEEYSKDSNNEMRAAVKALSDAFTTRMDAVINFVGQQATITGGYDNVYMVWGKKHYDEKYAAFIGGIETNRIAQSADPAIVVNTALGGALHHMNFHSGNAILAKAYDMWKVQIEAGGGGEAAFAAPDAFTLLQNIVGLAHFANAYRQDPAVFDALMASDAPIAITILQEYLEAQAMGLNDATVLRGSNLGFETIGSGWAGDTIYLDGPAWRAIARGGDDFIHVGAAPVQEIDGGTGTDTVVLGKSRGAYFSVVMDDGSVVLADVAANIRVSITNTELFTFNGVTLTFAQAFGPVTGNVAPAITSNGGGGSATVDMVENGAAVATVQASDANGDTRAYFIVGGADAALFQINASTGALTFRSAPDFETPRDADGDSLYEVIVAASDGRAGDIQTLNVRVTNVTEGLVIQGTSAGDIIGGTPRDDIVYGGGGNDTIRGGDSWDFLLGDGGDDWVDGEGGRDTIFGWTGDDVLLGGADNDLLSGEDGGDSLDGGSGDDELHGGAGDDLLFGGLGADLMLGGEGNDQYWVGNAGDRVVESAGQGRDVVYASISYALAAGQEVELLSTVSQVASAAINLTGNGIGQTLIGNAGDNVLNGGGGTDLLIGLGGRDTYYVDVAATQIVEYEGGGNDALYVSVSYTLVNGEVETLSANNYLSTQALNLTGNLYNQTIIGNAGVNVLNGGGGSDLLIGLGGNDLYYLDTPGAQIAEAAGGGNDAVYVSLSYALGGSAEVETLSTNNYSSTQAINLTGNLYSQTIVGNAGANRLQGGGGVDTLIGLGGNDTYYVDVAGVQIAEAAGGGSDTIYAGVSYALASGIEIETLSANNYAAAVAINLTGNAFAQSIIGNAGANVLIGGGGADILNGLRGNDTYYVDAAGVQVVEAVGGGSDAIYTALSYALANGAEVETLSAISYGATTALNLTGNAFAQSIIGNAGNNTLVGGGGADFLNGLGGNDIYYIEAAGVVVAEAVGGGNDAIYTAVSHALAAGAEVELLSSNDYASTTAINLTGNKAAQTIVGNSGANVLIGGGGADFLNGLGGNDTYYVDVAGVQVAEAAGGGSDTIYSGVSFSLASGQEVELLSANSYAATTAINLTGNGFAQTLIGNAGANILQGGGGADVLNGLGGNDIYYVDVAGVQVVEAAGGGADAVYTSVSFALAAGNEVERLSTNSYGATSAINLTGNAFGQSLTGNAGANILNGGGGADALYGMAGADYFAFTTALGGGNIDILADFSAVDDTIQLDDAIFSGLALGALAATAFVNGAAAADADDRIVYNSATGQLFYDADGNGAGAAIQFATLNVGVVLSASDFAVI